MSLFEQINRMQFLHKCIVQESTGTPCELAKRFRISKRHLYNLLDELKDMGAEIRYSRIKETFYYKNSFHFEISYKIEILTLDDKKLICAGNFCNNAILLHQNPLFLSL
ncbi:helix-turn-helix domain-containing protein [Phocaeicola sp.]